MRPMRRIGPGCRGRDAKVGDNRGGGGRGCLRRAAISRRGVRRPGNRTEALWGEGELDRQWRAVKWVSD